MTVLDPATIERSGAFEAALEGRPERLRKAGGGIRGPALLGGAIVLVFFAGLGGWAAYAPLSGAVVAQGAFEAIGNRKALQHRDGGIVRQVLVRDGDRVARGQTLLTLDDTVARTNVQTLSARIASLAVLRARLVAEQDDREGFDLSADQLPTASATDAAALIAAQRRQFTERRSQLAGELAILEGVAAQQRNQADGLKVQIAGVEEQAAMVEQEAAGVRKLLAKGFATKTRMLAMDRARVAYETQRSNLAAQLATLEGSIAETRLKAVQLRRDRATDLTEQLRQADQQLADLEPRLLAARESLGQTVMRAPAAGVVLGLNVFTAGGVIAAGQKVLEIVPSDGMPELGVQLVPSDAERVQAGQAVDVELTSLPLARRPVVRGHVLFISADRLTDERTGAPYYAGRVVVDEVKPGVNATGVLPASAIAPGMPAQVVIGTEQRTVLQYLLGPLVDQVRVAMREE